MRRRVFGVAAALVGLVVPLAAAVPAFAADSTLTLNVTFDGQGRPTVTIPGDWGVGDCFMSQGTSVTWTGSINVADSPKGVPFPHPTFHWDGYTKTTHTNNYDQWWLTVSFLDGSGNYLFGFSDVGGPQMSSTGYWYHANINALGHYANFSAPRTSQAAKAQVRSTC
ncbi:hypothetical protein [Actinomadura rupiterrae]|uniref:hypothetical protein n=1 Tax=Actinomadura rupiterrae TaxID=559627 RepID=UPI0020A4AE7D|nr:hypothetical protein [Actinomadura rupiterrae]MCP2342379.1 hypothetical protein [Actinomadura rupiterrae]